MKSIRNWAVAALAAGSLAAGVCAQAATHMGMSHGGWSGGHASGAWHGGGNWHGGGYWHGGGWHGYYPYRASVVGFYFGAPWVWGPWYWWGYPYDTYYAPYATYPAAAAPVESYPEGAMQPAPSTEVDPNAPGAPTQAPAYMNYCVSAKAYFPKVTTCPEGWKFVPTH